MNILSKALLLVLPVLLSAGTSHAHGIVGDRIFPATLTVDDPFDNDEIALPQVSFNKIRNNDGTTTEQTDIVSAFTKTITQDFAISGQASYLINKTNNNGTQEGFDNFTIGTAYQITKNAEHEFALLAEFNMQIGDSGSRQVGAANFNTYTPTVLFGKGFGDLPDRMPFLKPFAITGSLGYGVPSQRFTSSVDTTTGLLERGLNPQTISWGGSVQYSIPYLQQHIMNIGISGIPAGFIPIVEFALQTPTEGEGKTTGTVSPGIIWMGKKTEYALEAQLPATHATGSGVGVVAQVHFFIDDLYPNSLGKPLFGGN